MSNQFVDVEKEEVSVKKESANAGLSEWQIKIEAEMREVKGKISQFDKDKVSFITVSSVFIAIFTFVNVEIRFLQTICDFSKVIGFSFILAGTLVFFIVTLDLVARHWLSDVNTKSLLSILIVFLLSIGLIFLGLLFSGIHQQDYVWHCIEIVTQPE
jgi:hypothetical protein